MLLHELPYTCAWRGRKMAGLVGKYEIPKKGRSVILFYPQSKLILVLFYSSCVT